mmetsp:Transcript_28051/g.45507  ORF Transcript_28051/g.45507 Transcript_28051/m.45507 type:complete len:125 (-) Transcript_28051:428-802(-)
MHAPDRWDRLPTKPLFLLQSGSIIMFTTRVYKTPRTLKTWQLQSGAKSNNFFTLNNSSVYPSLQDRRVWSQMSEAQMTKNTTRPSTIQTVMARGTDPRSPLLPCESYLFIYAEVLFVWEIDVEA